MSSGPRKTAVKHAFGEHFIDSTESVANILEHFQRTNPSVFKHYCRLLGRRPLSTYHPHYLIPGYPINTLREDWNGILPSRYFEHFAYRCTMPKILTPMENIGCSDPVSDPIKQKNDWRTRLFNLLHAARKSNLIEKYEECNDDVIACPKHFLEIAAELDSDPDPLFNGYYNWWYSGNGNIHLILFNDKEYVLHSVFNLLYLTEFSSERVKIKNQHACTFNCGEGNNILEIANSEKQIIALRTKLTVIILKISSFAEEISFDKIQEFDSDVAITSIRYDGFHKNILYVTKLDNTLTLVNIDLMKGRSVKLRALENMADNWSSTEGVDRYYYCHIDRKSIELYDKRTNCSFYKWYDPSLCSDIICNEFSAVKKCENNSLVYLGTNHHLFLMDLRYLSSTKPHFVQRWTHQMQSPPTYISLCKYEYSKDLLCLSSQWYDDTCVIPNDSECFANGLTSNSIQFPFKPPTVENLLYEANKKMLCLDIYNPIKKRLYLSITGNAVTEIDDKYLVLTQNCLGDIFCRTLYPDHMDAMEDESMEHLHEWSKSTRESKTFEVSHIVDISNVWRNLKKVSDDQQFGGENLLPNCGVKFSEEEITKIYESEELDSGLLDVWTNAHNVDEEINQTSLSINLHFSDSDED